MKRFLFAVWMLLLCTTAIQASVLDQKYNVFSPQGLSSGTAYRIVRDHEGFMWISTRNGIDRYDGHSFRHYRLNGNVERGIHDGMMIYLYQDDNGELWVYTERSIVYHYNPLTDTFEELLSFPAEDGVGSLQDMYVFGDEVIFGVTNGLMSYEWKNGMTRVAHLLADREVRCITPYEDGCLLVGTNKGLAIYDPVNHRAKTIYDRLFIDVRSVCYDRADHSIWAGGNGQGLYLIEEDDNGRITRLEDEQLVVYSICPVSEKEVLVGTDGDGLLLARRTEKGCEKLLFASDTDEAIYPIHCSCVRNVILEDDCIWLAMHFGGVTRLQPASSLLEMVHPQAKSPSDHYVFGASFDQKGRVWLAFNQSIGCFNQEGVLQGLYLDHVARFLTVEAAPDGTVWCGGFNTGLYHFDPVTGEQEYFSSVRGSSSKDCVYAVHTDPRGYTWVGGLDFGMTCIIASKDRKIGDDPQKTLSFEHTSIRQICDIDQLNDSTLAIATSDGLYLYNYYTQRQEHLFLVDDNEPWQGTNFFSSLTVRHGHEIWLASDGAGLLVYDTRTRETQSFGLNNGIPSLQLRGVELVNDSTLCVATELDGLFAFDCEHRKFLHGLYYEAGNQFQQNSIATDGKGLVVAGCDKCAVLLSEEDMAPLTVNATIHIDGHPIIDGTITLPAGSPNLSLTFTTSDIYHQSEYHFFYRIKGLDEEFTHLDDRRQLDYHKMPAGEYLLEVSAVGAGGQWITDSVRIVVERDLITLVPHVLLVIVFIGLLIALHLIRKRQRK